MSIQIVSDLHLESPPAYDIFNIVPSAPTLALLGDIGNVVAAHQPAFLAFLTRHLRLFRAVLFVPGNHEAYHSNWDSTLAVLHAFQNRTCADSSLGDFILLDRATYRLPDSNVVVLGCSLFSHIPPDLAMTVSLGLNDFFVIEGWDIEAHNAAHRRDLAWLNAEVGKLETSNAAADDGGLQVMIFSHWSPSTDERTTDPKHRGSKISSGFATELKDERCFRSSIVKVWAWGHTHFNCDFEIEREGGGGRLRLVANQRGYYFAQADGFDAKKTIEL